MAIGRSAPTVCAVNVGVPESDSALESVTVMLMTVSKSKSGALLEAISGVNPAVGVNSNVCSFVLMLSTDPVSVSELAESSQVVEAVDKVPPYVSL